MNVIWSCEPPLDNRVSSPMLSSRDDKQEAGICGLSERERAHWSHRPRHGLGYTPVAGYRCLWFGRGSQVHRGVGGGCERRAAITRVHTRHPRGQGCVWTFDSAWLVSRRRLVVAHHSAFCSRLPPAGGRRPSLACDAVAPTWVSEHEHASFSSAPPFQPTRHS